MQTSYCLNLHEKYAPNWGVWEVVRELYANAKDAAPDTMKVTTATKDILHIFTPTAPDLAELLIIGHGSKEQNGKTIGQFGEGFKLAALAATRSGGRLIARIPGKRITFSLEDQMGQRVLFANVQGVEDDAIDGFTAQLEMDGAGKALKGRIIDGDESRILPKEYGDPSKIFCKGVWITDLDEANALFSYNLNDVELNRDRSHVDPWSVRYGIGALIAKTLTPDIATQLVKNGDSWESSRCLAAAEFNFSAENKTMLADAFRSVHGNAILGTDARASLMARDHGHEVVIVGDGLKDLLAEVVPTDARVMAGRFEFDELEGRNEWVAPISELRTLSNLCGITDFAIKVFADTSGDILGKAEYEGKVMWLNERLLSPDNRFELVRTFLHELGHLQSGAGDATTSFEASLDLLLTKLALVILNQGELGVLEVGEVA